jgi:hypothetical protein
MHVLQGRFGEGDVVVVGMRNGKRKGLVFRRKPSGRDGASTPAAIARNGPAGPGVPLSTP